MKMKQSQNNLQAQKARMQQRTLLIAAASILVQRAAIMSDQKEIQEEDLMFSAV